MSNKMPISWHEQNLINRKYSLELDRAQLERLRQSVEKREAEFAFAEEQVAEAKRRGLDEFDPDRFLVKRPKKS